MKHFFHQTFLFWVITKFLLALAGLGSIFSLVTLETGIFSFESMANGVIVLYGLLLGYSAYADIRSIPPNTLVRLTTGTLSMVSGFGLLVLLFLQHVRNPLVTFVMALWVVFLGWYEWTQLVRE